MAGRSTVFVVLVRLIAATGCSALCAEKEPEIRGHPLSYWVDLYGSDSDEIQADARRAISEAGSNAVPYLLSCVEYKPAKSWDDEPAQAARLEYARRALGTLGSEARSAIPRLIKLARESDSERSARGAWTLATIGPEACPELLAISTDTNAPPHARAHAMVEASLMWYGPRKNESNVVAVVTAFIQNLHDSEETVAAEAAMQLGNLKVQPERAVPALSEALRHPRPAVRKRAAWALGEFGPEAKSAIPTLGHALNDPETVVRQSATNALLGIKPEALTNAPAQ